MKWDMFFQGAMFIVLPKCSRGYVYTWGYAYSGVQSKSLERFVYFFAPKKNKMRQLFVTWTIVLYLMVVFCSTGHSQTTSFYYRSWVKRVLCFLLQYMESPCKADIVCSLVDRSFYLVNALHMIIHIHRPTTPFHLCDTPFQAITVTESAEFGFNLLLRRPQGPQGCLEKQNCPLSFNLVV